RVAQAVQEPVGAAGFGGGGLGGKTGGAPAPKKTPIRRLAPQLTAGLLKRKGGGAGGGGGGGGGGGPGGGGGRQDAAAEREERAAEQEKRSLPPHLRTRLELQMPLQRPLAAPVARAARVVPVETDSVGAAVPGVQALAATQGLSTSQITTALRRSAPRLTACS